MFHAITTFVSSVNEPEIRDHFVATPSTLWRDLAGVDRALQLMNRFTG
ncbi:hypothetical protein [Caballeronia sp. LZ043]|nr:hypothetical protein [Caballeronia sp. LZ043]MDR5822475.1 hypothetical protein [Caballeronia sp. LZ043]